MLINCCFVYLLLGTNLLLISSNVPVIRPITAELYSFRLAQRSGYPFTTLIILRRIGGSIPKVEERSLNPTSSYPVTSLLGNRKSHLQRDATLSDGGELGETPLSLQVYWSKVSAFFFHVWSYSPQFWNAPTPTKISRCSETTDYTNTHGTKRTALNFHLLELYHNRFVF